MLFRNIVSYLSGCIPISIIQLLLNIFFPCADTSKNQFIMYVSIGLFVITILSGAAVYRLVRSEFETASIKINFVNVRRKNSFSSGALSLYIIPFISFVGDDYSHLVILLVLLLFMMCVYVNNRMFMYTPLFDLLGYKNIEADCRLCGTNIMFHYNLLVQSDKDIFFSGENICTITKIDETTACAKIIRIPEKEI